MGRELKAAAIGPSETSMNVQPITVVDGLGANWASLREGQTAGCNRLGTVPAVTEANNTDEVELKIFAEILRFMSRGNKLFFFLSFLPA